MAGRAALGIWQLEGARIDLLFADMVMPTGIGGHELIAQLLLKNPWLKVIATTGYSPDDPLDHSTPANRIAVIGKPYGPAQLLCAVRERLDQPIRPRSNRRHGMGCSDFRSSRRNGPPPFCFPRRTPKLPPSRAPCCR